MTNSRIDITAKISLPTLDTVLGLPSSIGGVPVSTITGVLKVANGDISKMIEDIKAKDWLDTAELTATDAMEIASIVGVPGIGIAATFAPYLFDVLNAEIRGKGHVTVQMFIDGMIRGQSNIGTILDDLKKNKYADATRLELDDALDIVGAFMGGPYATLAKVLVNLTFAIIVSAGLEGGFNQFFEDITTLPETVINELEGKMPEQGAYVWSPLWGWVLKEKK